MLLELLLEGIHRVAAVAAGQPGLARQAGTASRIRSVSTATSADDAVANAGSLGGASVAMGARCDTCTGKTSASEAGSRRSSVVSTYARSIALVRGRATVLGAGETTVTRGGVLVRTVLGASKAMVTADSVLLRSVDSLGGGSCATASDAGTNETNTGRSVVGDGALAVPTSELLWLNAVTCGLASQALLSSGQVQVVMASRTGAVNGGSVEAVHAVRVLRVVRVIVGAVRRKARGARTSASSSKAVRTVRAVGAGGSGTDVGGHDVLVLVVGQVVVAADGVTADSAGVGVARGGRGLSQAVGGTREAAGRARARGGGGVVDLALVVVTNAQSGSDTGRGVCDVAGRVGRASGEAMARAGQSSGAARAREVGRVVQGSTAADLRERPASAIALSGETLAATTHRLAEGQAVSSSGLGREDVVRHGREGRCE